jgi:rhomboid family GlyGly-CTERM serine protease
VKPVVPVLAASLTALALLLQTSPGAWALSRAAILDGEYYRMVTGHLVHFNRAHVLGDVLAFAVWAAIIEQRSRALLAGTVLLTTVTTSLVLLAMYPGLSQYRGLSAVDCALVAQILTLGVLEGARTRAPAVVALFAVALGGFAAKTAYEFVAGRALLAPDLGRGVELLPVSHALGIACGVAALCADRSRHALRPPARGTIDGAAEVPST